MANDKIKVGDTVMWRHGWGKDPAKEAVIESIDLCSQPHEKYGQDVPEVDIEDKDRCCFSLKNGHWAYGTQIDPLTTKI
jgi:hypothetical protein